MCPLRRVEDGRAGPAALGILVPPARRTFLILRPRTLPWDLVLLGAPEGWTFRDMSPLEAETTAHRLYRALDAWSVGGEGSVGEVANPQGPGFCLQARIGPFALLVCPRLPGQPYRPQGFADLATARAAAEQLLAALRPPPDVVQECYLNTRHFGR